MKILKVLQVASGDLWAGAEVQFYNLCRKLQAFPGVQLQAVLLNAGLLSDELEKSGVRVTILDEQTLSSFAILGHLMKLISEFQPDIIHSHRLKENVLSGMASLVFPRSKCLTTVHGASETPLKLSNIPRTGYKLAESLIVTLRFAEKIYVSHELQSRLEGASGTKSRVIENGIDLDQTLKKAGSFPEPVCKRGIRHIGFLGRLVPVKRPDILLEIVKQTAHRDKLPYVFHVIGDGPLFDEFQTATARKGLSKHIVMHGFCANPLPLLATMDCLLITSDHEGLPTNLLEAMCLGIPVIAHAVGEIPRVLEFGKLGTLIESQDVNSYSDALKKCLSTDKPGHLAANMLNRVKDHYSADRNAERYLCLYQEVLSMPKADMRHTFNK